MLFASYVAASGTLSHVNILYVFFLILTTLAYDIVVDMSLEAFLFTVGDTTIFFPTVIFRKRIKLFKLVFELITSSFNYWRFGT